MDRRDYCFQGIPADVETSLQMSKLRQQHFAAMRADNSKLTPST